MHDLPLIMGEAGSNKEVSEDVLSMVNKVMADAYHS